MPKIDKIGVLAIDGTIEPAKYEGRVIKNTRGRVMTITLPESFAKLRAFDNSDMDHIYGVIKLEPDWHRGWSNFHRIIGVKRSFWKPGACQV
ncbi:hypothetical protein [Leptolyngbya sp. 7M]|uniref:hypothetical protein n=1 Tax=Leptolyngbya sp. 7M TaxID=2812896 RepID=UPI001B8D4B17|nr:hypothetical protein [Leptolyngbya sp. 7M]QYO65668.1 hypothetical protein JVX88_02445 [Leptolyngbya sp. 7M]